MTHTEQESCAEHLPVIEVKDYFAPLSEGIPVEFRLTFRGPLPSAQGSARRNDDKARIRAMLHPQLVEYWKYSPWLSGRTEPDKIEYCDQFFKQVSLQNHIWRFLPLIGEKNSTSCSLDILFLRRDFPGGFIKSGGDIDNRIKVLLDGLRMPFGTAEIEDAPQPSDFDPLYCLLEDDKYIEKLTVTTDRLLTPLEDGEHLNDVHLVIHVQTRVYGPGYRSFWCR